MSLLEFLATSFSCKWQPPPPLIRLKCWSISSAPSTVRSKEGYLSKSPKTRFDSWINIWDWKEVGTPFIFIFYYIILFYFIFILFLFLFYFILFLFYFYFIFILFLFFIFLFIFYFIIYFLLIFYYIILFYFILF